MQERKDTKMENRSEREIARMRQGMQECEGEGDFFTVFSSNGEEPLNYPFAV